MVDVRTCIRRFSISRPLSLSLSLSRAFSHSHRSALPPSIGLVHEIARITVCVMCQITHINYLRSEDTEEDKEKKNSTQTHRIRGKKR